MRCDNKSQSETVRLLRESGRLIVILMGLFFASCVSVRKPIPPVPSLPPQHNVKKEKVPEEQIVMPPMSTSNAPRHNVVHTVAPGETLWRISKMYSVKEKSIILANRLKSDNIEKGQKLIVPNAAPIRPVIPLYPSHKWKYIIIHHSATEVGDALIFDAAHCRRGFNGLGYDFVIDNGSCGKPDGDIEVSPRWIKQMNGAHCKASGMNYKGIGICLVGNFDRDYVSQKQLKSLVYLVNLLRKYYHIPLSHIMGHGQVPGANTHCPGRHFPWKEFWRELKNGS